MFRFGSPSKNLNRKSIFYNLVIASGKLKFFQLVHRTFIILTFAWNEVHILTLQQR